MTEDFNPLVSIVIPVYNGSNYMREAIDSALAQTYKNIEVLVINDGSNDGGKTKDIAESYGDKIRYFEKENGGVSTALNLGITEMKGEYFSWLSHDDVYYPFKIKDQINYLYQHENKDLVLYSDYDLIDKNSKYIGINKSQYYEPFRILLLYSWPVNGCSTLIKKSILFENNFFDVTKKYSQDYYLWFKLAKKYEFVHLSKSLIKSRSHDDQGTLTSYSEAYIEIDAMYKSFIDTIFLEEDIHALFINKKNILKGLKIKNHINLIVYFLDHLIRNEKIQKNTKLKMKVEKYSYILLLFKNRLITNLRLIKQMIINHSF